MKKIVLASFLAIVLALLGCGSYGSPASPVAPPAASQAPAPAAAGNVQQVTIQNFAFSPASITIKKGDTVNWTNQDGPTHTVTGSGFDSGRLAPGKSYSFTFSDAGSFSYQCNIHPSMKGTVVVQP